MHLEKEPAGEGSWGSPKSQGKEKRKMLLRGGSEVSGGGWKQGWGREPVSTRGRGNSKLVFSLSTGVFLADVTDRNKLTRFA